MKFRIQKLKSPFFWVRTDSEWACNVHATGATGYTLWLEVKRNEHYRHDLVHDLMEKNFPVVRSKPSI